MRDMKLVHSAAAMLLSTSLVLGAALPAHADDALTPDVDATTTATAEHLDAHEEEESETVGDLLGTPSAPQSEAASTEETYDTVVGYEGDTSSLDEDVLDQEAYGQEDPSAEPLDHETPEVPLQTQSTSENEQGILSFSLSRTSISSCVGGEFYLTIYTDPYIEQSPDLEWTSSNPNVVQYESSWSERGESEDTWRHIVRFSCSQQGKATITATVPGTSLSASCEVTVTGPSSSVDVLNVGRLSPASSFPVITTYIGSPYTAKVAVYPATASQEVRWSIVSAGLYQP